MSLDTVKTPSLETLRGIADELGMTMSEEELVQHREAIINSLEAYNLLDRLPDELPAVRYPRTPGYRPSGEENRYNAWYVKCVVEGAAQGRLRGKKLY